MQIANRWPHFIQLSFPQNCSTLPSIEIHPQKCRTLSTSLDGNSFKTKSNLQFQIHTFYIIEIKYPQKHILLKRKICYSSKHNKLETPLYVWFATAIWVTTRDARFHGWDYLINGKSMSGTGLYLYWQYYDNNLIDPREQSLLGEEGFENWNPNCSWWRCKDRKE